MLNFFACLLHSNLLQKRPVIRSYFISTLEKAIALATAQHRDQKDKAGQPYITHPLRVMQNVHGADAQMAAVMHDLLEDTNTNVQDLAALGFSQTVIDAVIALTKLEHDSRYSAAQRTVKNAIACQVKLADLTDNMDLSRLTQITVKDLTRLKQYQQVYEIILEAEKVHWLIQCCQAPNYYPSFEYASRQQNYQFILNLMLDIRHPFSGLNMSSAQKYARFFKDCAAYFSWCKRQRQPANLDYAQQLIYSADPLLFDRYFSDAFSQNMISQILQDFQKVLL
jgi:hypothetical protein